VNIDGSEFDCKSVSVKAEMDGFDVIKPMNRKNRASGKKYGVPNFDLSVEIERPEDDHELDFWQMMLDQDEFTTIVEYQDGTSKSFYDCSIKSVDESPASGDCVVTKLEIVALDYGKN
jgi:hypothetical protein